MRKPLTTIDQCADAIAGANSLPTWKLTFAESLRNRHVDMGLLDQIQEEAERVVSACKRVRMIADARKEVTVSDLRK